MQFKGSFFSHFFGFTHSSSSKLDVQNKWHKLKLRHNIYTTNPLKISKPSPVTLITNYNHLMRRNAQLLIYVLSDKLCGLSVINVCIICLFTAICLSCCAMWCERTIYAHSSPIHRDREWKRKRGITTSDICIMFVGWQCQYGIKMRNTAN